MSRKYACKADDNQPQIVAALRAGGAFVQVMSAAGQGVPDSLVGYRGYWRPVEIKDGGKPPCERKLTKKQVEWIGDAQRYGPVSVVENVEQAQALLREMDA